MKRVRFSASALMIAGVLVLGAPSALAGTLINTTEQFRDVSNLFIDVQPCTGEPIEVSTVESGVTHFVLRADGTITGSQTIRATFSADILPTDGVPDATGHYTVVFTSIGAIPETGDPWGNAVTTFILNGVLEYPDGSTATFHVESIATFDSGGNPRLAFDKALCQ